MCMDLVRNVNLPITWRQQVEILHLGFPKVINSAETRISILDNWVPNCVIKWLLLMQHGLV